VKSPRSATAWTSPQGSTRFRFGIEEGGVKGVLYAGSVAQSSTPRVQSVVIDVADLDRGSAFWSGLLGLQVGQRRDEYLFLDHLAAGVSLVLQQVPDEKRQKYRVHVEVHSDDPQHTIDWVLGNGGRLVEAHETDWYSLVVLADPDGNEFCVNQKAESHP
jgi:predicted enzyme related to lactoylglutathione lyase